MTTVSLTIIIILLSSFFRFNFISSLFSLLFLFQFYSLNLAIFQFHFFTLFFFCLLLFYPWVKSILLFHFSLRLFVSVAFSLRFSPSLQRLRSRLNCVVISITLIEILEMANQMKNTFRLPVFFSYFFF